jgi:hypothetical protein
MRRVLFVASILGLLVRAAAAEEIPLANWTVPPFRGSSASGLATMTDISPGVAFVAFQPCRVVDTRGGGVFTGAYGPPSMAANAIRSFDIDSAPHCTGIPAGSEAYSLNFTVTGTGGEGDIRVWPTGNPPVQVTSVLNFTAAGVTIANATIIPAGTGGSIDVFVAGSSTQLLIDINGYFTDTYNTGNQLIASGSVGGDGMVLGTNVGGSAGSAGVKGVQGTAVPSAPEQEPAGVVGTSSGFDGVLGITIAGSGGAGVRGIRTTGTSTVLSSGELGVANLGGRFVNDVEINGDILVGTGDTTFGPGNGDFGGNVNVDGNLNVLGGTKNFVEPHATDASKVIRYVSLEGPESGTYFRGRGRFQNGIARIRVPEDFRTVTADEGLTVQITPIGGMATVGVLRMDLHEIVAQSSRNLEFSYLVQGVRRAFADLHPIDDAGTMYVRRGVESRLPENFPPDIKRRLIENGTFNADGTVNMDTARRLGWDRIWAKRQTEPPRPQRTID